MSGVETAEQPMQIDYPFFSLMKALTDIYLYICLWLHWNADYSALCVLPLALQYPG